MRSPQTLKILALVPILLPLPFAQGVGRAVSARNDVVLRLEAEGSHQFHLGEFIPMKFCYAANTPSKYFRVADYTNLEGGHSLEISCSPAAELVRQLPSNAEELTLEWAIGTFFAVMLGLYIWSRVTVGREIGKKVQPFIDDLFGVGPKSGKNSRDQDHE